MQYYETKSVYKNWKKNNIDTIDRIIPASTQNNVKKRLISRFLRNCFQKFSLLVQKFLQVRKLQEDPSWNKN